MRPPIPSTRLGIQWLPGSASILGLAPALVLVVLVAYVPHLDVATDERSGGIMPGLLGLGQGYLQWGNGDRDDYEFPLHVDENTHWANIAQLQRQDTLRYDDPYTGAERTGTFQLRDIAHERGYYVALAYFQDLTTVPWGVMIRFMPALIAGLTAWMLWASLHPWPGAPVAAAFVALVPTSDRFLGPGFLVPIAFALPWILFMLPLAHDAFERRRNTALLAIALSWTFFLHFMAGLAALLLLVATLPFHARRRRALPMIALGLVPVLWLIKTFLDQMVHEATKYDFLPTDRTVFFQLGLPFLGAWIAGAFFLAMRKTRPSPAIAGLAIASGVAFLFLSANLGFHLRNYFLYERWHQPFALFAAAPVAALLVEGAGTLIRSRRPRVVAVVAMLAAGSGLGILHVGVQGHLHENYYHLFDPESWTSIEWAAQSLPAGYGSFLSDPWRAPVIAAVTGRHPVTWLDPGSPAVNGILYETYRNGGSNDGAFLLQSDATWVLDSAPVTASQYVPLGPGVWGLDPAYLAEYNSRTGGP